MTSTAIVTVVKMMEGLPENTQNQVLEHLRDYLEDIRDEQMWDKKFEASRDQLANRTRGAKQAISSGLAVPMKYELL